MRFGIIALIVFTSFLCACNRKIERIGTFISENDIRVIHKGITTKEEVFNYFGQPSIEDDGYIYIGLVSERGSLIRRRNILSDVTYFKFSNSGTVSEICRYSAKNLYKYKFINKSTALEYKKPTTLKALLSGALRERDIHDILKNNHAKISPSKITDSKKLINKKDIAN